MEPWAAHLLSVIRAVRVITVAGSVGLRSPRKIYPARALTEPDVRERMSLTGPDSVSDGARAALAGDRARGQEGAAVCVNYLLVVAEADSLVDNTRLGWDVHLRARRRRSIPRKSGYVRRHRRRAGPLSSLSTTPA